MIKPYKTSCKSHQEELHVDRQTGELTGYPSIDKPWLKYFSDEAINEPLPNCTLYEYLYDNNKDNLNGVAINYYGNRITYNELFKQINTSMKKREKYACAVLPR